MERKKNHIEKVWEIARKPHKCTRGEPERPGQACSTSPDRKSRPSALRLFKSAFRVSGRKSWSLSEGSHPNSDAHMTPRGTSPWNRDENDRLYSLLAGHATMCHRGDLYGKAVKHSHAPPVPPALDSFHTLPNTP